MIRRTLKISLLLVLALGVSIAFADEGGAPEAIIKKNVTIKTVSGEVSGISSNFLAILYGQDAKTSYELALVIDKDTKVERKNSLKEIMSGDTVSVQYEEITQTHKEKTKEGKEKDVVRVLGRLVKVVSFIKAPAEGLKSLEEPVSITNEQPQQEEAADLGEPQEGESQK